MILEILGQIFEKYWDIKFHQNPSSLEPSCSMRTERRTYKRTDVTKLTVAFRNFANAPKNIPDCLRGISPLTAQRYVPKYGTFMYKLWAKYIRHFVQTIIEIWYRTISNLMFIWPCIIAIVDEWKTNLMSLAVLQNKTTDVVIHQQSRKLLKMNILMSETCWLHNKCNKMSSDIKLVFHSSTLDRPLAKCREIHYEKLLSYQRRI